MKAHVTIPRAAAVTHLMRVAVAVACLFPYLQVLHHGFVAVDDQLHTYLNPILNGYVPQGMGAFWTAPYMDLYIPVTYTVWALVHAVSGGGTQWAPMPFHGTNLLLHIANAVLAFEILRLMLRSLGPSSVAKAPQPAFATEGRITIGAGLGAFVFALHPLQVEAVAWVSGLKDVLSGTLALVSLLLFLRSDMEREHQFPLRFVSSLLCMALAVLSKPSAVILSAAWLHACPDDSPAHQATAPYADALGDAGGGRASRRRDARGGHHLSGTADSARNLCCAILGTTVRRTGCRGLLSRQDPLANGTHLGLWTVATGCP